MIPGLTVLDHPLRIPGHMCSAIAPKPGVMAQAHSDTLEAMSDIGADTLVTIFHSCHRDAVALERGRTIRVVNWIHLLAEGMGLPHTDEYKHLAECRGSTRVDRLRSDRRRRRRRLRAVGGTGTAARPDNLTGRCVRGDQGD